MARVKAFAVLLCLALRMGPPIMQPWKGEYLMTTPLRPVVDEQDLWLRCAEPECIRRAVSAHRVVWGMVYSPRAGRWLVQRRRLDKDVCPGLWDMSCAGHVDCRGGAPESYGEAYQRELQEELGLTTTLVEARCLVATQALATQAPATSAPLGITRQFRQYPGQGGMVEEHEFAGMFLTLWDGPVLLGAASEPMAIAWFTELEICQELIATKMATPGLAIMLSNCDALVEGMSSGE
jgi:isopentenyldiphosphate isomerase